MTLSTVLPGILIMTTLVAVWLGLHLFLNPRIKNPDGYAKITGPCGDTMELELQFSNGRVKDFHYWTDGCSISKMCIATAAVLARGKTVPELEAIDQAAILKEVGNLPETHLHCARLAALVLETAVARYAVAREPA